MIFGLQGCDELLVKSFVVGGAHTIVDIEAKQSLNITQPLRSSRKSVSSTEVGLNEALRHEPAGDLLRTVLRYCGHHIRPSLVR